MFKSCLISKVCSKYYDVTHINGIISNSRHAFHDLLNKSEEETEEKNAANSSASNGCKLILSCSFLIGYFEKNKNSYEGCDITKI